MSILYCSIPYFAAAVAQRDNPAFKNLPLVLIGPGKRVLATSAQAESAGIIPGITAHAAEVRCPQAKLIEADPARYQAAFKAQLELLEEITWKVEPQSLGTAYLDMGDKWKRTDADALCRSTIGRLQRELGFKPILGWNSTKFTAQAASYCTHPGHARIVPSVQERTFLYPLPVTMLPLETDTIQRLKFLGLRTLGQYARLPPAAVIQQFGRPGVIAQRCARGTDERPVQPRAQEQRLQARWDAEDPLLQMEQLLAVIRRIARPLLIKMQDNLQTCGQMLLGLSFADAHDEEQKHVFLFPTAREERIMAIVENLLQRVQWRTGITGIKITFDKIRDMTANQLRLFPVEDDREIRLRQVQQQLAARFGSQCLRKAIMVQPLAPLPEWRIAWETGEY